MGDKINGEYFEPGAAAFNYNNVTGGADSASGGSGGSGMECLQLRSPPGPFHYLISEQAKSLVALQELQNEVGALLEFRDLVIETFPNLRSKMAPSTPASGARRDWEPGVRVRRKLAGPGDAARAKPQPSVQDSGFSTETSCGKDAHTSGPARPRPLEDELWALLDVIHRKGGRVRDEADLVRAELDDRPPHTAEEQFSRALAGDGAHCADCADVARLREERDQLLVRAAQLEAGLARTPPPAPAAAPGPAPSPARALTPLGRLDAALETPARPPCVAIPDSKKFAAILLESNPAELQRQLLTSTVQKQVLCERLRLAAAQRTVILERLERARDLNEDLKFRLEEKSIELEGARARVRQLEGKPRANSLERHSMRDMQPLHIPDVAGPSAEDEPIADTPRRRPSRIPLHKGAAPRPPAHAPAPRPPSAHSAHSAHSVRSARSASSRRSSAVPVRRDGHAHAHAAPDAKRADSSEWGSWLAEYVSRAGRLQPLLPHVPQVPHVPRLPHAPRLRPLPHNLHQELERSVLYSAGESLRSDCTSRPPEELCLWANRPQQYFESMNYGAPTPSDDDDYDTDSLAP